MAIDMVIGQLQKEMSTNVCTHCIKSPNRQKEILDCSYGNGAHASRQTEQLLSNSRNKKRFNSQHSSTVSGRQINVKYPRYSHSLICPMMCSHQSRKFVTVSVQLSVMSVFFFFGRNYPGQMCFSFCEQLYRLYLLYHSALW